MTARKDAVGKGADEAKSSERRAEGPQRSKAKSPIQEELRVSGQESRSEGLRDEGKKDCALVDLTTQVTGEWRGGRRLEMPIFSGDNPDGWVLKLKDIL